MAWDVQESWQSQTTSQTIEENGVKGSSDVSRFFTVVADSVGQTTLNALAAPGLPRRNDPHPQSFSLRARSFSCNQTGPLTFEVTVGYESLSADPNDPTQDPLAQPASVSFSSVTQEVEIDEDVNGDPIETVNGEPLAGVTRPFTDLVITVRRNLPSFDPASISTYMNKVNSAVWYGLPAGTVRIMDISAQNVFAADLEYWDVSISFQVRRGYGSVTDARAWWYRTAHQGYVIEDGAGNYGMAKADPADDFTANGTIVAQPVMIIVDQSNPSLATTGERAAIGDGYYVEFQVLETIDFNNLNLL